MAANDARASDTVRKERQERKAKLLGLYIQGLTNVEIGKRLGISRVRVWQLIQKYKFLPQSRYMLEGALCRDWMLRHRPKEYRQIVEEAAEQSSTRQQQSQ